ncbi:hypothetical protein CA606_18050 [Caulobacter vibrioides]|uniref:Uncharacterized protein n=1 Tax=Caulobacter vibrioides TaxID=155892 RepID=A0A290MYK9_CAUVI|nr:hypothetical protein [Caulobacter vibrioides]ATC34078.1 hypothetical protein CA606_18050 [Caulobacter vibrioides]
MADGTKSLGEKLFDSLVVARAETTTWAALSDQDRTICEKAALDFCARLSHDEPARTPAPSAPVEAGDAHLVRHCAHLDCTKAQRCVSPDACTVKAFAGMTREWLERKATLEGDHEVGAGVTHPTPPAVERIEIDPDIARGLPGGQVDLATYEAIEEALDKANAPVTANGKFLTLAERVAAMAAHVERLAEAAKAAVAALQIEVRANEMSAGIMRDPARTGGWEGAGRTANAFARHALKAANIRDSLAEALATFQEVGR